MRRRPRLFRWLPGAGVIAMGLVLGCGPGQVGTTNPSTGAGGAASGTGSAGDSGNAGTSGDAGTSGSAGTGGASGLGASGGGGAGGSTSGSSGGGTTGAAGASGRGGTTGTAGASGRGGTTGTAGASGTSGAAGRGGTTGTAGASGTSGTAGRGGTTGGGGGGASGASGSSGTAGTGGMPAPTQCTLQNHSGNGSFTWYNFAQGTARDGSGYRTACGYYGTANGTTDTVENIASMSPAAATYFVAVPGQNGFDSKSHCGECVQITGQNGTVIIATVTDECPYGSDGDNPPCANNPTGHLDLSYDAFQQLCYSRGDPTGTSWRIVPCPVTGNVKVSFKQGNNNEIFIENGVTSFSTVTINGLPATRQKYGAWHIDGAIMLPAAIHTVDRYGRTLDFTLNSNSTSNQDTGQRSPTCQ